MTQSDDASATKPAAPGQCGEAISDYQRDIGRRRRSPTHPCAGVVWGRAIIGAGRRRSRSEATGDIPSVRPNMLAHSGRSHLARPSVKCRCSFGLRHHRYVEASVTRRDEITLSSATSDFVADRTLI